MLARSDGGDESLAQNQAIQAAPLSARFVPTIGTGVARVTPRVPSDATQAHDAAWPSPSQLIDVPAKRLLPWQSAFGPLERL